MDPKDKELLHLHRTFFWQSEKIIKSDKWEDLDELYQTLPADHMHINDSVTMGLLYVDPNMRKVVNIRSKEELIERSVEESSIRIDPINYQRNVELTTEFIKRGNKHEVAIIFQHMNIEGKVGDDLEWFVTFMKLSDKAKGLFCLDFKIEFLDKYQNKFMKIIALDQFVHMNMDKFQELSPREIEIMTKVAKGSSSQEIAEEFSLSKLTVDTHRKNLMNKLGISRFVDLIRFAEAFDLV